ncbi:MAG: glycoside hydrolase [Anaerolineae bacterium]|nr:MAG: glycoside hydrolase [Anaerolineae bacterium]
MLLEIENCLLSIEREPHFRLTGCRSGNICLRTSPHPQPVLAIHQTDIGLNVEFSSCTLSIIPNGHGCDLRVWPETAQFSLSFEMNGYWYGHGELIHQQYPLNRLMLPESPFQSFDNGPAGQSCKPHPAWFSSQGISIIAHSPVSVGINQPPITYPRYHWTLGADKGPFSHRPFADPGGIGDGHLTFSGPGLHLTIHLSENARAAYQYLTNHFGHPTDIPPEQLFRLPTWTTWARYKMFITQETILNFADEIIQNGYPYGVLEIDDRWQMHYGDLAFDPRRFPDPRGMIARLHEQGFQVTAWVIPFFDPASDTFAEASAQGYLLRQPDGTPYPVRWWQGIGGLLDVTNPRALAWFRERLAHFQQETGLDGYKFDAGEAVFFPSDALSTETLHPNQYTQRYIEFIAQHFRLTEVRSAWKNQRAPIFFRQWDKESSWGLDNGLHSVLSGILSLGLCGYPFILPDMIGGNAYDCLADAELMIRWTQLNALLPAMQFSLAPWDYGAECNALCRRYAELHLEFAPHILAQARQAAQTGEPIIRPLWWLAPHNEHALTCNDQFLLGNDILVAPVVHPGQRTRDIYLPPGVWCNYWTGTQYQGETILHDFPAPLETLPLFTACASNSHPLHPDHHSG